jgi:hypothetical protein
VIDVVHLWQVRVAIDVTLLNEVEDAKSVEESHTD